MKNLSIILLVFILTACSRAATEPILNEELYFKNNEAVFMKMKREELSSQSKSIQILTINNYNTIQKVSLFKDKLSKIINENTLNNNRKNDVIKYAYSCKVSQHY